MWKRGKREDDDGMDSLRANTFPFPQCFVLPWAAGDRPGGGTGSQSYEGNAWALFIPPVRNSLGLGALGWPSSSGMGSVSSPNRKVTLTLRRDFPSPCPFHIPF